MRELVAAVVAGTVGGSLFGPYLLVSMAAIFGIRPLAVLEWDTSNITGIATAASLGWRGVIVGQVAHYVVAMLWAGCFVLSARRVRAMRDHPIVSGIAFGLIVMLAMTFAVVPLGRATPLRHDGVALVNSVVAHTLFFGIPIAYTTRFLFQNDAMRRLE